MTCARPKSPPKSPAGILIWCDADDSSRLPASLYKACDELNLILAGFSQVGNDRPIADRLQRALDAWMTVGTRFHTNRRRVYATGISGGASLAVARTVWTGSVLVKGSTFRFDKLDTLKAFSGGLYSHTLVNQ